MLTMLVNEYGAVVSYSKFNKNYQSACPGTVTKMKSIIQQTLTDKQVPCDILTKTSEGYYIQDCAPRKTRKKRVRKR